MPLTTELEGMSKTNKVVYKHSCISFGNDWLKYCTKVHFWGGQQNILRVILGT